MRRVLLLSAAVLATVVACRDVTQQNPKQAKKTPAAQASAAAAPAQDASASTVCAAYRQQLGQARAAMMRTPDDESLKQNVDTYQAIIADACN